jgi:hypothetical protein
MVDNMAIAKLDRPPWHAQLCSNLLGDDDPGEETLGAMHKSWKCTVRGPLNV